MAGRKLNSVYMLAGQVTEKAGLFLSLMVYARILSDQVFGELLLATSVGLLMTFLSDMGVTLVATRKLATGVSRDSVLSAAFVSRTILSLTALCCILLAVVLAGYSRIQVILVAVVTLGFVLSGYADTSFSLFRAREKMLHEGITRTVRGVAGIVLAIYAWKARMGPVFAGLTYVLRELPTLVYSTIALVRATGYRPDFTAGVLRKVKPLLLAALPLGVTGILISAGQRIDGFFIKEYLGDASIAAYQQCLKLFEALILLVTPTLIPGALFPAFCKAVKTGWGEARMRLAWMTELFLVIAFYLVLVFWWGEEALLRLLWGEGFLRGITQTELTSTYRMVLLTLPVAYMFHLYIATFVATAKQKDTLPLVGIPLVVEVGLFFLLVPLLGTTGAAITQLFFLTGATVLMVISLNRQFGATGFIRGARRPVMAFVPALMLLLFSPWSRMVTGIAAIGLFTIPWLLAGGYRIIPAVKK